jgi:Fe2+ transport system protein A
MKMISGGLKANPVRKAAGAQLTLKEIRPHEKCIVLGINTRTALRKRIIDMGLTIGTEIYVRKLAPLGDPMEINVRGYELSLRKTEASEILVKRA